MFGGRSRVPNSWVCFLGPEERFGRARTPLQVAIAGIACFLLSACAVKQVPVQQSLELDRSGQAVFTLNASAVAKASNASKIQLRSGTRWTQAGSIARGDVFKSRDQTIALVAFNTHEAWLVLDGTQLIGFYLPVERSFVAAEPLTLSFTMEASQ